MSGDAGVSLRCVLTLLFSVAAALQLWRNRPCIVGTSSGLHLQAHRRGILRGTSPAASTGSCLVNWLGRAYVGAFG
jgi:hypothetical protein